MQNAEEKIQKDLPAAFLERMKHLLGEEYPLLLKAYTQPAFRGVRRNPAKCSADTWEKIFSFPLKPAPFSPFSYYFPWDGGKLGGNPLHHAGAFYSQEPSAASAVTILDPQPGERILDLCAAPGGKSSQIAALLEGKGLLWSNEVIGSRASILLSNLERMGVSNGVVSSCETKFLCEKMEEFFDRVLVDAPCSGEGMFRKEEQAVTQWNPELTESCAARQAEILDNAARALRPGGLLVYSTCTFAPVENEETIYTFLRRHPEFHPEPKEVSFGRKTGEAMWRIYPMDGGEGHFVACLRKDGWKEAFPSGEGRALKENKEARAFQQELFSCSPWGKFQTQGKYIYLLPEDWLDLPDCKVLRAGVQAFEQKGNRLEPCHHLFMAATPSMLRQSVDFEPEAPNLLAFLRGEEISVSDSLRGWTGVSVAGVLCGFGKASGGRLKNRYPKGLRLREQRF